MSNLSPQIDYTRLRRFNNVLVYNVLKSDSLNGPSLNAARMQSLRNFFFGTLGKETISFLSCCVFALVPNASFTSVLTLAYHVILLSSEAIVTVHDGK